MPVPPNVRSLGPVTVIFILALAACAGDEISNAEVRPFEEVQASEFVFEVDPTNPSRAIFRVDTTEPMICAIVWGEDESFGNFNNSLNMAGTGIVEHDVFLPGAEPGVEYSYVVQGTTADGTLYRSDTATFTIEDVAGSESEGDDRANLATEGQIVEVSSEFNDAFAAANAIDGDPTTEWSTDDDGDEASITVELASPMEVTGFAFLTRSMTDGSAISETYTVTVDASETFGPFPAGNPAEPEPSNVEVTGQRFTFEVESSTGGNTGAVEIWVLGG